MENVLTGIYQIPLLSVPFPVLTLGFGDSWFPKRPLTVKLNKGWGRPAGQELLLSLHHSFVLMFHSQAEIPFPVLGTHRRAFSQESSNILSPCGQCQPFQSCQSRLFHTCFSALSLTILELLTHSYKRQIRHKPPMKGGPGQDQTVPAASVLAGRDAHSPEHSRSTKCQISISTELWL